MTGQEGPVDETTGQTSEVEKSPPESRTREGKGSRDGRERKGKEENDTGAYVDLSQKAPKNYRMNR